MMHSMHMQVKHNSPESQMSEIKPYNSGPTEEPVARSKTNPQDLETFARRLIQFRQVAGLSQYALAHEMGVTQRIVSHYERAKGNPPLYLLPRFAKALDVSVDQLLGLQKATAGPRRDNRLRRRIVEVEKLPPRIRKKIIDLLDAFLGKSRED